MNLLSSSQGQPVSTLPFGGRAGRTISATRPAVWTALTLAGLAAPMAQAHPGHSVWEASPSHVLASPYHLLVLGGVGLALVGLGCLLRRPGAKRLLQGTGLVCLAAAGWAALQ